MVSYLDDLRQDQYEAIAARYEGYVVDGIAATNRPKRVAIVGAGVSGLVAGSLLKGAGHEVTIYEAQNRCGGRCHTYRQHWDGTPFRDGHYIEAGAMRLPTDHKLLMAYIKKLGLETRPFFNRSVDPSTVDSTAPTELSQNWIYCNGVKIRRSDYAAPGGADKLKFPVMPQERGLTAEQLLAGAIEEVSRFIGGHEDHWKKVIERFGEYSLRRFLKEQTLYSEGAIELIGVLTNHEARMMLDFIQVFLEIAIINEDTRFREIVGGTDLLPKAFLPELEGNIRYEHVLQELEWDPDGEGGVRLRMSDLGRKDWYEADADEVIITIPFPSLRFVRIKPLFSHEKRTAIRELHYDAATKVMLEFSERFWEGEDGIYGGGTITDLPNRNVYYPSHGFGEKDGGIILACYCWADDARRWDSLHPQERFDFALEGLAEIHGQSIKDLRVGSGCSKSWMQDPFALGEAAMFAPGQLALLQPHIQSIEGNVHFAGEHTSLKHAWIEGAMESGIRAALEVNGEEALTSSHWA